MAVQNTGDIGMHLLLRTALVHADHPPQTSSEWEQWLASTRTAKTKNSLALRADGIPNETEGYAPMVRLRQVLREASFRCYA